MSPSSHKQHIDRFFFWSVMILTVAGFIIFLSASLGLLAKNGVSFGSTALRQALSLGLGLVAFWLFSRFKYLWLRKWALPIFIGSIVVNLLLFIPQISLYSGGASRWISIGLLSFQPSELLKLAFVIYLAAWVYFAKDRIKTMSYGLVPYLVIMGILGVLLLVQSDTDTLVIIGGTGLVMLFIAGVRWRHIAIAAGIVALAVLGVIYFRPYALKRIETFLNPSSDTQGASYQINQSLIAIGSGQLAGRGFGQSIQKFGYLPQPTDDSIFAVAAEEFGFVGSVILIGLYILLAVSIFRIATSAPDQFGALVAVGIGILVVAESFFNIAAMLGLLPLSGVPLLFVSHGGTALIITLSSMGIVGNVSKYKKS